MSHGPTWRPTFCLVIVTGLLFAACMIQQAAAQTFHVLYRFHGTDGEFPSNGVTMDGAGRLYGTTSEGGTGCTFPAGCGTVFQFVPRGSGWVLNPLHQFTGGNDGLYPDGRVRFGPDGRLYGVTQAGGVRGGTCPVNGCGTLFNLQPPAATCHSTLCPWTLTVIHAFQGGSGDGLYPIGDLAIDPAGNVYGATDAGGPPNDTCPFGCGTAYELMHVQGGWTNTLLYAFSPSGGPGYYPSWGLILGDSLELFGTTGADPGAVFELAPSGGGWTETTLPQMANQIPYQGNVVLGPDGALYGGARFINAPANIFRYTPNGSGWTLTTIYTFPPGSDNFLANTLAVDAAGSLYGLADRNGVDEVFKLTNSQGGWTYTALYDFQNYIDGIDPSGQLLIDANGNIYGTAAGGGEIVCPGGCGVVWEITP